MLRVTLGAGVRLETMSLRLIALTTATVAATTAALPAGAAPAATTTFAARTLTEPAATSLAVSGPLKTFVAGSKARVVVPAAWAAAPAAPAGALRFTATQNSGCHYAITYSVRTVVGDPGDAGERVDARLPAASSPYLLDRGVRGSRAFRIVREKTASGRIRLRGLWNGVLTKRSDIVPAGKVAWTEIRITVTSRAGDECHAGTYRDALGPNLGDSLAVARTGLHFTKAT